MKNKIVSKALAGVLSAATLIGSGIPGGGLEAKAYSSNKKAVTLLAATGGVVATAAVGIPLLGFGIVKLAEHCTSNQLQELDALINQGIDDKELKNFQTLIGVVATGDFDLESNIDFLAGKFSNFYNFSNSFFKKISDIKTRLEIFQCLPGSKNNILECITNLCLLEKDLNILTYQILENINSSNTMEVIKCAKGLKPVYQDFRNRLQNLRNELSNLNL